MKKIKVYVIFTMIVFMFSCQKEINQDEINTVANSENESWLTAKLDHTFANSQKRVTAYLFPASEMGALIRTPNIIEVRFVLGYSDNTIQIESIGVDNLGNPLGSVKSIVLKEFNENSLNKMSELSLSKTQKRTSLLTKHLLLPKEASVWIEAWQKKLNTVSDLNEITAYEGSRFQYFSIESEIIKAMVNKDNAEIGIFLGLNTKGKMTTILIGLDKNNAIKKISETSQEVEDFYDGTRPCPPLCVSTQE
ncbi:hypothetical protein [Flavobacterium limi]|uniref:Lipoprotein n=1 Tax=Flavobacterium limi TaxID=2045105 RepID=A0ABQ1UYE9_9FLAO|nr:hypothetical protein [Flavobacterium limi]GGF30431.1 hypothetical protein GCM10011518_44590 [Flavobacterium limi]